MVNNYFPSITRKEIRKWLESNLCYSLHKPSSRTFKCKKMYVPEVDSLLEAALTFVRDVDKEM